MSNQYAIVMEMNDARQPVVVYRLCKRFPPGFPDEYMAAAARRSFAGQPGPVQLAASGLSVYTTIDAVLGNARKFPRLGSSVVRYAIPLDSVLQIVHLVGPREHVTVLGEFSVLHACLDESWHLNLVTIA